MADRPMHTVPGLFARLTSLYGDAEAALAERRFADAIAFLDEGLGLDDHFRQRYITMYAQRAFAKQNLGDAEGAIPDYTKAIEMEPEINQAQYYFQRGMCHAALDAVEEAVADYGRSIALHDGHPGPFHLRGKLLSSQLGRHAEAIRDFDRMLAMQPHPEAYQLRGYSKLNLKQGRDAIPDLLESQRLRPDTYTDYLLCWAGAIAPDDELFYKNMAAVLGADDNYRQYFAAADNEDFLRFHNEARFKQLLG